MIATLDLDLYPEDLFAGNPDFAWFFHTANGAFPRGVPRGDIYAFTPMSAQAYARLLAQGQRLADA